MNDIAAIPFGRRRIGPAEPVVVIAEIGINHEGSVEICAEMIEAAHRAGADAIKLQTIDVDANYVPGTESHAVFSGAALGREETARMFELARSLGMEPLTTAGDPATLAWVDALAPSAHKISSGLMTHTPVIRAAAATGRPVLVSTGMATVDEIDAAVAAADGAAGLALFHCTSLYPAPPETLHLAAIPWLAARYRLPCGFSDHSVGAEAPPLSVAAGATMIEKHFTLDPSRPGYDHPISLDERGLAATIDAVRSATAMRGQAPKPMTAAEADMARRMHRILVAARDIEAGERLDAANVGFKRPLPGSAGLPPGDYDRVKGRVASMPIGRDEPITDANTRRP